MACFRVPFCRDLWFDSFFYAFSDFTPFFCKSSHHIDNLPTNIKMDYSYLTGITSKQ